jgi:hypothetical protein
MNNRILAVSLAIAACMLSGLLTGCVSSDDISRHPYFVHYIGGPVPLQTNAVLVQRRKFDYIPPRRKAQFVPLDADLQPPPPSNLWRYRWRAPEPEIQLQTGHSVVIDRVQLEFYGDAVESVAYGRTTLPNSTNELSFAYYYGAYWQIGRAPWEPSTAPHQRWLDLPRPHHWDYDMFKPSPTNSVCGDLRYGRRLSAKADGDWCNRSPSTAVSHDRFGWNKWVLGEFLEAKANAIARAWRIGPTDCRRNARRLEDEGLADLLTFRRVLYAPGRA